MKRRIYFFLSAVALLSLTGCESVVTADPGFGGGDQGCYAPMVCGAVAHPLVVHDPYLMYLHDPVHYSVGFYHGHVSTTVVYRAAARPVYRPAPRPAAKAPAFSVPRPAAPRPAAPRPAMRVGKR